MKQVFVLIDTKSGRVRVFDNWPFETDDKRFEFEIEGVNRWRVDFNKKRGVATLYRKIVLRAIISPVPY